MAPPQNRARVAVRAFLAVFFAAALFHSVWFALVVRAASDPSVDNSLARLQSLQQYHPAPQAAFVAAAERVWSELAVRKQSALLDLAYAYSKSAYDITQDPIWVARTAWAAAHRNPITIDESAAQQYMEDINNEK